MYNKAVALWLRFTKSIGASCKSGIIVLIFDHHGFAGIVVQGAV